MVHYNSEFGDSDIKNGDAILIISILFVKFIHYFFFKLKSKIIILFFELFDLGNRRIFRYFVEDIG